MDKFIPNPVLKLLPDLKDFREMFLYAAFGFTALAVELSLFYISINWLSLAILLANFIAISSGMLISFSLNAVFNFKVTDNLVQRFLRYSIVIALGYIVSSTIILALVGAGIGAVLAKVMALPVVFLLQFTLNKKYTF